jgi:hypothetical protein
VSFSFVCVCEREIEREEEEEKGETVKKMWKRDKVQISIRINLKLVIPNIYSHRSSYAIH